MRLPAIKYLPVIFRVIHGEVLALFPTLPYKGNTPWGYPYITCYAQVGQHGEALRSATQDGRLATPAEYADLLRELRGIYENPHFAGDEVVTLKVVSRRPPMR